jgi:hypothetical protein
MIVEYSDHARDQMKRRQVTEAEVEFVLENPSIDWPSKEHPETRRVYTARPRGRKVSVVTVNGSDPPLVVTVWAD